MRPQADPSPTRLPLTGAPEQVLADIDRFQRLGVTNLVFRPGGGNTDRAAVRAQIEYIAESVLPHVRR